MLSPQGPQALLAPFRARRRNAAGAQPALASARGRRVNPDAKALAPAGADQHNGKFVGACAQI